MKQLFILPALALSSLAAVPAFASDEINVPQINQVIADVIKESFENDDLVKKLFIKFDEKTTLVDTQKVRMAAQAGGTVARTPWDKTSASTLGISADVFTKDLNGDQATVHAALAASARTDVLKLVSYIAREIVEDYGDSSSETRDDARILEIVKSLQQTESLEVLHAAIVELHEIALRKEPALAEQLNVFAQMKNGQVESLNIRFTEKEESFFGIRNIVAQLKLSTKQSRLSLRFDMAYPEQMQEIVESAKTYLLEIQNRSEARIEEVKSFAKGLRDALADLVEEEFVDAGAGI